ncbi:MAG: hypothetical protein NVSMB42_18010 [Herpetosiphon sp.]
MQNIVVKQHNLLEISLGYLVGKQRNIAHGLQRYTRGRRHYLFTTGIRIELG